MSAIPLGGFESDWLTNVDGCDGHCFEFAYACDKSKYRTTDEVESVSRRSLVMIKVKGDGVGVSGCECGKLCCGC